MIHKYTGLPLNIDISNISEKSLEVICLEWLRSDLCPNIYKLKFQLLLTGGNYGKVDAYGQTFNNKTLAAQITFSHSKSVINKKLKNLNTFSSDMKLLFCDLETDYHNEIPVISIREVWKDLFENGYSELLEKLINE